MSEAILSDNSIIGEEQQAKDWTPAKVIYTGLMAFNLLSFLWLLVTGSSIEMPPVILIARIVTVPLAIYLGKLWKDRGFQILAIYTCLFFFRVLIPNPSSIFSAEMAESIFSAFWLFAGCYGLGKILSYKQIIILLLMLASIWLLGIVIISCIGIYAAWTYQSLFFPGMAPILTWNLRLELFYPATTTGSILSVSSLIAMIMAICSKNRIAKCVCLFASVIILIALALTDSRTAYISISAGISSLAIIYIYKKTDPPVKDRKQKQKCKFWLISFLIFLFIFAISVFLIMQITPAFNQIKTRGIIASACAEQTDNHQLYTRGFEGHVLSGRAELWGRAFEYIRRNPSVLILGESKIAPLRGYEQYYSHNHCIYLQVLIESGIIGFFLVIFFLIHVFIRSAKTIQQNKTIWICLLPALLISLCIGDIAECFLWLRSSQCPMNTVFFIVAGIITSQTSALNSFHLQSKYRWTEMSIKQAY